ncbi:MAG: DUF4402 domain-containing protein [Alphaproteobacteria bacterium]|nr:DUF4402 domain-containing protein [Alphaproteobacteria bacterium]
MRKHFITTIVALFTATNVNATQSFSGTLTVSATVERTTSMTCEPLNFGTILLPAGSEGQVLVNTDNTTDVNYAISVTGASTGYCSFGENSDEITDLFDGIDLSDEPFYLSDNRDSSSSVYVKSLLYESSGNGFLIGGVLYIGENVPSGTYTGSFTVTITY